MKTKKFDLDLKLEKLEDILEEKLQKPPNLPPVLILKRCIH